MNTIKSQAIAWFIFVLILLLTVLFLRSLGAQEVKTEERALEAYIDYFHQTMKPKYSRRAKRLIPYVLKYSDKHGVDPLLMGCLFSFESSWRNFEGGAGEQGPGQVMPEGKNKKVREINGVEYDLSKMEGQIDASCAHMRESLDSCDTLEGAFTHYATGGKCKLEDPLKQAKMRKRARHYEKMKKRFKR